ncbi:NADP-dependent oxidoreductase [Mesonia aestuariivivens]|uniref:NADP-dependent oxidoreductase n=1 Tax=Mesonia aestuariivivens TaxID=2796128 RepID=A0ABS6W0U2_9FLAO|nr:NADP-dependent oxidoreductase [Mesonia aestuariivivens]MBW2961471.1 NADP-dependent oxidoreductase [Mesonia aestuariivivens]
MKTQSILLKQRPEKTPQNSDFEFKEEEVSTPKSNEVLLKSIYISVDPYLRGRMRDVESYIEPFQLNEPITSAIIAKVEKSEHENFKEGDYVLGHLAWKEYQVAKGENLRKVDPKQANLSAYLGILGMTGLTAYFGLTEIGAPKEGETVLVSGAAGAVGSTVGQIAKIYGCKTIGIAGSDEKIDLIKGKFNYDEGINYKTTDNMKEAISKAATNGIDVYYDNVGGEILDATLQNINRNGRVINCGAISQYNKDETATGPRVEGILIKKSVKMQGFTLQNDFGEKFNEGTKKLAQWLQEGKLNYEETIREGFEKVPQAFIDLFSGENKGKMVVKVAEE